MEKQFYEVYVDGFAKAKCRRCILYGMQNGCMLENTSAGQKDAQYRLRLKKKQNGGKKYGRK